VELLTADRRASPKGTASQASRLIAYDWARDFSWIDATPTGARSPTTFFHLGPVAVSAYLASAFHALTSVRQWDLSRLLYSPIVDLHDETGIELVLPLFRGTNPENQSHHGTGIERLDERLLRVRAAFGLSTAELARVLKTRRSNLYNWFTNPGIVLHRSKDTRLRTVEALAQDWLRRKVGTIGAELHAPIEVKSHGRKQRLSLLELLTADPIDERAVREVFTAISRSVQSSIDESRRLAAMREAGFDESIEVDF